MKHLNYFLVVIAFATTLFLESDKAKKPKPFAVVSVDRTKVVYRGIPNPLTIVVPGAIVTEVTGNGVSKTGTNKYNINPGPGLTTTLKIKAKLPGGKTFEDEQTLRIQNSKRLFASIGSKYGTVQMRKNDIATERISLITPEMAYDFDFKTTSFNVYFPKSKVVNVNGDYFNEEAKKELEKLSIGDTVFIPGSKMNVSSTCHSCLYHPNPLFIIISE